MIYSNDRSKNRVMDILIGGSSKLFKSGKIALKRTSSRIPRLYLKVTLQSFHTFSMRTYSRNPYESIVPNEVPKFNHPTWHMAP